jgi:hypothetical protein
MSVIGKPQIRAMTAPMGQGLQRLGNEFVAKVAVGVDKKRQHVR